MDVDIGIRKDLQPQYTGEEIAVFLILNYLQNDKNENLLIVKLIKTLLKVSRKVLRV